MKRERDKKNLNRRLENEKRRKGGSINSIIAKHKQDEEETQQQCTSPFTIVCNSQEGELLKIASIDFQRKVMKDRESLAMLVKNYNHKFEMIE